MTARRLALIALAVAATMVGPRAGGAVQLVVSPSTSHVMIASNYAGTRVVLFGGVEGVAPFELPKGAPSYDVVVTVTGPSQTLVARRKERVLGVWANVESRTFVDAPSYLAVLANRPLDAIAAPTLRDSLRIGLDNVIAALSAGAGDAVFRAALIGLETAHGAYAEKSDAVVFFAPGLFRADIALPPDALVGTYAIDVKLFSGGVLAAQGGSTVDVRKVGIVQFIVEAASRHALLYGIVVTAMALGMGWLASVVFRRD